MDGSPIDVMQKIEKTVNNSHATLNKSEPTIVSVGPREKMVTDMSKNLHYANHDNSYFFGVGCSNIG